MTENLQADGVQSRQTLFVRYCLKECYKMTLSIMKAYFKSNQRSLKKGNTYMTILNIHGYAGHPQNSAYQA